MIFPNNFPNTPRTLFGLLPTASNSTPADAANTAVSTHLHLAGYFLGSNTAIALGTTKNAISVRLWGYSTSMLHPHIRHPSLIARFSSVNLAPDTHEDGGSNHGPRRVRVRQMVYQKIPMKEPRKADERRAPMRALRRAVRDGRVGRMKRMRFRER